MVTCVMKPAEGETFTLEVPVREFCEWADRHTIHLPKEVRLPNRGLVRCEVQWWAVYQWRAPTMAVA